MEGLLQSLITKKPIELRIVRGNTGNIHFVLLCVQPTDVSCLIYHSHNQSPTSSLLIDDSTRLNVGKVGGGSHRVTSPSAWALTVHYYTLTHGAALHLVKPIVKCYYVCQC